MYIEYLFGVSIYDKKYMCTLNVYLGICISASTDGSFDQCI